MALSNTAKKEIVSKYQRDGKDTGSSEVQIALLTANIQHLTAHMKTHKHDFHSRHGLIGQVNKRRKLLSYLKKKDAKGYRELIEKLGLRK
jgi:small subunit ribosomal protein S15